MNILKLGILEQVPLYKNRSVDETIQQLVTLVKEADRLGYIRFWLAEHHNTSAFLSSAPDILAGYLLGHTEKIRIGTGGVMAMHYGSLQIAERFATLAALYPNRVDLGLGRAPGTDLAAAKALNQGRVIDPHQINQIIEETLHFLRGDFEQSHRYASFKVSPMTQILPEFWLLGSSGQSAAWAAEHQMNYAYAQFFTGHQDKGIMDYYRSYYPKNIQSRPNTLSALSIIAADTKEEAEFLSLSILEFRYRLENGFSIIFRSPEDIQSEGDVYIDKLKKYREIRGNRNAIIGTYDEVAQQIQQFSLEYGSDEIMLITYLHDQDQKIKTYTEIAKRLIEG